jgi:hypothetical protein
MKIVTSLLVVALAGSPLAAQAPPDSIRTSADRAAAAAAASDTGRSPMFWTGLALGIAGIATAVVGVTTARIDSTSSGNAPDNAFQSCVAAKSNPIYATNNCDALKGKNRAVLWSGVAIGAAGAVLLIGGSRTHAEITPGAIALTHTIRF